LDVFITAAGIVGLQYLPVSIARLSALNLSFVKKERTYLLILNVRYFCSSKVARILLKNLSFPVSLFLIVSSILVHLKTYSGVARKKEPVSRGSAGQQPP
jgi:hypothetical protein